MREHVYLFRGLVLFIFALSCQPAGALPFDHRDDTPEALTDSIRQWWRGTDHTVHLDPETLNFLFGLLADQRVTTVTRSSGWNVPRKAAIEVLSRAPNPVEPRLEKMFSHEQPLYRMAAIHLMAVRGGFEGSRIDRLFHLCSDEDESVRGEAAQFLARVPERHEEAATQVIKLLEGNDAASYEAARSAGYLAPMLSPATAMRLAKVLFKTQQMVHRADFWAIISLGRLMPLLPEAAQRDLVDQMLPLLKTKRHQRIRVGVISAAGPLAEKALPGLRDLLAAAEGKDKAIFAGYLWKVEGKPDSVYGIFMEAVGSAEGSRRHYGFKGLQLMGPQAKAAVPALQDLLQQEKTSVRTGALKTLAAIGPGAVAAAPLVRRHLKAPDKNERALAQEALDAIQVW
ncbi:MAG: HEAT repeat domain-containing protein [Verrucomicrobiota bacterium]